MLNVVQAFLRNATLYIEEGESGRRIKAFLGVRGSVLQVCNGLFASIEKAWPVMQFHVEILGSELSLQLNGD